MYDNTFQTSEHVEACRPKSSVTKKKVIRGVLDAV